MMARGAENLHAIYVRKNRSALPQPMCTGTKVYVNVYELVMPWSTGKKPLNFFSDNIGAASRTGAEL